MGSRMHHLSRPSHPFPALAVRKSVASSSGPACRRVDERRQAMPQQTAEAPVTTKLAGAASTTHVTREARAALFGRGKEQAIEVEGTVTGSIPEWLEGSLVLNGPGDALGMLHMFDGYAMLCKLRVSQGRVYGSQKYIDTKARRHFERSGRVGYTEFGTPSAGPASPLLRLLTMLARAVSGDADVTDNASVNVLPLPQGRLLAMSEGLLSWYKLQASSLATLGQVTFEDDLPGVMTTAHPKALPDGALINFSRTMPFGGFHVYKQDPQTLRRTEIAFIKDRDPLSPAWVHDMALSANHLVILEHPLFMSLPTIATESVVTALRWRPEQGTRVHVVPLRQDSGGVRTFHAPAFFTFHQANAFEADGSLHVDVSGYDDASILQDLYLARLRAFPGRDISRSWLRRLSIPLAGGTSGSTLSAPRPLVQDESLHGHSADFPYINPAKGGERHQYVWVTSAARPTNLGNALAKLDVQAGDVATWHEPGAQPSGPVFVAAPGASAEDEGVLLSAVMSRKGNSFLLVLDASTMAELARAELPFGIPYRFHGGFMKKE